MFWFGSAKKIPTSFRQQAGGYQIEISIDQGQSYIEIAITDGKNSCYQRKILKTDLEDKKDALTDLYEWLHTNGKELIVGDSGDLLIPAKSKGGKMTKIKTYKQHSDSSRTQDRVSQLESANYLLAEELKIKDRRLLDFEQKISSLSKMVKNMQEKMVEMGEEMKRVKERCRLNVPKPAVGKLGHHQDNIQQHRFVTRQSGMGSLVIKKIGNNGYYDNFINYMPIEDLEKVRYRLRFLRLADKALWLGFGTKAAFGNNTNHCDVCFYSCWNGDVWGGSAIRQTGIQTGTGQELQLLADRTKNTITYMKGGKLVAETEIPPSMKGKQMFLFLQFRDKDDEVQVSEES